MTQVARTTTALGILHQLMEDTDKPCLFPYSFLPQRKEETKRKSQLLQSFTETSVSVDLSQLSHQPHFNTRNGTDGCNKLIQKYAINKHKKIVLKLKAAETQWVIFHSIRCIPIFAQGLALETQEAFV